MPAFQPSQARLSLELPDDVDDWVDRQMQAFDDTGRTSGFLPLAEQAVDACPGNPIILTLAATAAVLDRQPERALKFLKRICKRYEAAPTHHLLHALALFQDNKREAARTLLRRHRLTELPAALQVFPS